MILKRDIMSPSVEDATPPPLVSFLTHSMMLSGCFCDGSTGSAVLFYLQQIRLPSAENPAAMRRRRLDDSETTPAARLLPFPQSVMCEQSNSFPSACRRFHLGRAPAPLSPAECLKTAAKWGGGGHCSKARIKY